MQITISNKTVYLVFSLVVLFASCASIDEGYSTLNPDDTVTRVILDESSSTPDNKSALNYYNLAVFHMEQGNFTEAEKQYKLALSADGEFLQAINNLAYLYALEGRYSEAKALCVRSLDLEENNRVALVNLGLIYSETQEFELALDTYQKLLSRHPDYAEGFYGYARILILLDRPSEALGFLEEAAFLYNKENSYLIIDVLLLQGIAHYLLDETPRATGYFEQVLGIEAENSLAQYYLEKMNS